MRVSFTSMTTARAAVNVLEAFGYSAEQIGRDVITNCPTLLAVPAIEKRFGLAEIEHLDLSGGNRAAPSDEMTGPAPLGESPRLTDWRRCFSGRGSAAGTIVEQEA